MHKSLGLTGLEIGMSEETKVRKLGLEDENRVLRARLGTLDFLRGEGTSLEASTSVTATHQGARFPDFEFNASRDTGFAHAGEDFGHVLHIFNAEYFGIRAAAGNLPGGKLAVCAERPHSEQIFLQIITRIQQDGYDKFVLHGYSEAMDRLARHLHKALSAPIYCVWHGNFAQLVYPGERTAFEQWMALQSDGIVTRAHILKQNASDVLENGYGPMLLNLPPKWKGRRISPAFADRDMVTALMPSWADVRKNWHANLVAAEQSASVHRVFHYADAKPLFGANTKARHLKFDPVTHMDVVASVDLVLNATLIDCHPMVDLEALACGTPVITARLFLGEIDRHPYARLSSVENALDTKEIAGHIGRIAGVPEDEMAGMMKDYLAEIVKTSFSRYQDFLHL